MTAPQSGARGAGPPRTTRQKLFWAAVGILGCVTLYHTSVIMPAVMPTGNELESELPPSSLRTPTLDQHLPPGWASATDPASKKRYYYHRSMKITQWNLPAPTVPTAVADPSASPALSAPSAPSAPPPTPQLAATSMTNHA